MTPMALTDTMEVGRGFDGRVSQSWVTEDGTWIDEWRSRIFGDKDNWKNLGLFNAWQKWIEQQKCDSVMESTI
jgi:hypothetical protein